VAQLSESIKIPFEASGNLRYCRTHVLPSSRGDAVTVTKFAHTCVSQPHSNPITSVPGLKMADRDRDRCSWIEFLSEMNRGTHPGCAGSNCRNTAGETNPKAKAKTEAEAEAETEFQSFDE
jgi:hypothetical protein